MRIDQHVPNSGAEPKGVGKGFTLKSQMKPARLFKIASRPMNTATWLRTGAWWIGLKHDALDQHAAGEGKHQVRRKAIQ